jgi:hypothetical protein
MDFIGTYSNHRNLSDQLKRTWRWLSEARRTPFEAPRAGARAKAKAVVPRRVVDRLGDEVVRELVEARRAGTNLRELVERYEVSGSSLKRLLRGAAEAGWDLFSAEPREAFTQGDGVQMVGAEGTVAIGHILLV